jgi:peptidyl-prolyl cis-trans isomerase SurA
VFCWTPPSREVRLHGRRLVVALLLALVLLPWAPAPTLAQDGRVIDEIAAVVGDEIVLRSEVDALVEQIVQQQQATRTRETWMGALNQLIDQKVMAEVARRDTNITVSEQMLDDRLDMRMQQLARQAGSEEQLEMAYGKSVIELKEDYREDFREQLLAQQLRSTKLQDVEVTPSEVRAWFEQIPTDSLPRLPETVRLSHIVRYPKISPEARAQARELVTALRDSIVSGGASFEAMAEQFSDDPGSAADGGRIAGIGLSDLVPEFAAVAARTEPGEVSQVFFNPTHKGFHILRVNDRTGNLVDFNHILVKVDRSQADASDTIAYLSAVRDTLVNQDVSFEVMAKRHSEDQLTSNMGGRVFDPRSGVEDLVLEYLDPTWRSTIRRLEEGEVGEPTEVRLLDGDQAYHILRLDKRVPPHQVNLKDDYEQIEQYALQDKRQRVMNRWMEELREEVFVDIRVDPDDITTAQR